MEKLIKYSGILWKIMLGFLTTGVICLITLETTSSQLYFTLVPEILSCLKICIWGFIILPLLVWFVVLFKSTTYISLKRAAVFGILALIFLLFFNIFGLLQIMCSSFYYHHLDFIMNYNIMPLYWLAMILLAVSFIIISRYCHNVLFMSAYLAAIIPILAVLTIQYYKGTDFILYLIANSITYLTYISFIYDFNIHGHMIAPRQQIDWLKFYNKRVNTSSYLTNPNAERIVGVIIYFISFLYDIVGIIMIILGIKNDDYKIFIWIGIGILLMAIVQWAYSMIIINISNNLFNINSFLRARFGEEENK